MANRIESSSASRDTGLPGFAAAQARSRESTNPEWRGRQAAHRQPGGYLWPEIRIGREASFSDAYHWDYFINLLGNTNRRRGHAVPLGQVACHYITDTEMRNMILASYPDVRRNFREARKVYRGVAGDIRRFLRGRESEQNNLYKSPYIYREVAAGLGKASVEHMSAKNDLWLPSDLKLREIGNRYTGYDGGTIGLDLSRNRGLYEERNEVVNYLKHDLNFDTEPIRKDWEPHAVIFRLHPHLTSDGVLMKWPGVETERPADYDSMSFNRTEVISDNLDASA